MVRLKNESEDRARTLPPTAVPMGPHDPLGPPNTPVSPNNPHQKADVSDLPVIAERFFVMERRPQFLNADYQVVPESEWVASPVFDTQTEVDQWLALYQPDEGNEFIVKHEFLRQITTERWFPE